MKNMRSIIRRNGEKRLNRHMKNSRIKIKGGDIKESEEDTCKWETRKRGLVG